jgi:LysR family transcriptional regulator, low CO2-responsive transcriptional regulator
VLRRSGVHMQAILSQAVAQIGQIKAGKLGQVSLGVVSTAKYFAPALVKSLITLHPDITIALSVGNRNATLRGLETGQFDLAIMGRPPRRPLVEAVAIGPHPHAILAPPDHPLARSAPLSWADLRGQTFIAREIGSGTRLLMQRYLDHLGDGEGYATIEMDSNETIKQAVLAGLGIAFLSLHTVVSELRQGALVVLQTPQAPVMRHWFVVHDAQRDIEPACAQVLRSITALGASFLPADPISDSSKYAEAVHPPAYR